MFFCILLIGATNVSDSHINYFNNQFHSNLYNFVNTEEFKKQNTVHKNSLCNEKIQRENYLEDIRNQKINKFCINSDPTYKQYYQHTHETNRMFLIPNKDDKELFQNTESTDFFDRDDLMDASTNTVFKNVFTNTTQHLNDILSATDFLHTKITERNSSMINNEYFSAQVKTCLNTNFPKQIESITDVQENKFLIEHQIFDYTDNYTKPNNQNIEDIVIETDLYKEIDRYIHWEPSEYDDKKKLYQKVDFEHGNNNLVDSSFIHCAINKNANVSTKEVGEYSNINFKKSLHHCDLIANYTKEQKIKNTCFVLDCKTTKIFSSDNSYIVFASTINIYKKDLRAFKDKFFENVRKQSNGKHIQCNLTKNSKYVFIRQRITTNSKWFFTFRNSTVKFLIDNVKMLHLSANTKTLIFDYFEFLRKFAQFIANFKNYIHLQKYNYCDIISNITFIEAIKSKMIVKYNFEKIKILLQQIVEKDINPKFFNSKVEKKLMHILCNIQSFGEKFKIHCENITELKEFFDLNKF